MSRIVITGLLGDGIGGELRESIYYAVGGGRCLPLDFVFQPLDLSLEGRERGGRQLFEEVAATMRDTRVALKYPIVTRDVSPNAIIRRLCSRP